MPGASRDVADLTFPWERLRAAKAYLYAMKPWWGRFGDRFVVVPVRQVPPEGSSYGSTTATDQSFRLYVDSNFAAVVPLHVLAAALEHEFQHHTRDTWRRLSWLDPDEWRRYANVALDLEINGGIDAEALRTTVEDVQDAVSASSVFTLRDLVKWGVTSPVGLDDVGWTPRLIGLPDGLSAEDYLLILKRSDEDRREEEAEKEEEPEEPEQDGGESEEPEPDEDSEPEPEESDGSEDSSGDPSEPPPAGEEDEEGESGDEGSDGSSGDESGEGDASDSDGEDEGSGSGEGAGSPGEGGDPGAGDDGGDPSAGGDPNSGSPSGSGTEAGAGSPSSGSPSAGSPPPTPGPEGGNGGPEAGGSGPSPEVENETPEVTAEGAERDVVEEHASADLSRRFDELRRAPELRSWANEMTNPDDPLTTPPWMPADDENEEPVDRGVVQEAFRELEEDVLESSAAGARAFGDGPGGSLLTWAERHRRARGLGWESKFARIVSSAVTSAKISGASDLSYSVRNPNQQELGPVLMGMHDYAPVVYVIQDVSGSMRSFDGMSRSIAAFEDLATKVLGRFETRVTWITVDVSIVAIGTSGGSNTELRDQWRQGGGGTSISSTIEAVMSGRLEFRGKRYPRPDFLVVSTDCEFPWPRRRPARKPRIVVVSVNTPEETDAVLPPWLDRRREVVVVD